MGRRRILRQRPHGWPRRGPRTPAPRFHAASFEIRKMLEAMYRAFVDLRAEALEALREGRFPARFPAPGIPTAAGAEFRSGVSQRVVERWGSQSLPRTRYARRAWPDASVARERNTAQLISAL